MCIIVDANAAGIIFAESPTDLAVPVIKWLFKDDGVLVHGGQLTLELGGVDVARRMLFKLKQAGKLVEFDSSELSGEVNSCESRCRSNDVHVIALARVSGARTLITQDKALMADFTDRELVSKPKGKVYTNAAHKHLLVHTKSCPRKTGSQSRKRQK